MSMEELLSLPVSFTIPLAARALGIGESKAYAMAADGTLPCGAKKYGTEYRVTRPDLFRALGLDPAAIAVPVMPGAGGEYVANFGAGSALWDAAGAKAQSEGRSLPEVLLELLQGYALIPTTAAA